MRPNLRLTFDATNLTKEIYRSFYGENGATTSNIDGNLYSRTFALGLRTSF